MTTPTPQTVTALLDAVADARPEHVFVRFDGADTTYAQFAVRTRRVAGALRAVGVKRGDRVAIMSGNRPEFLETWFAATRLAATEVPVNAALRGRFLAHLLSDSAVRVIVIESSVVEHLADVVEELSALEVVVVLDGAAELPGVRVEDYEALVAAAEEIGADEPVELTDISVIGYTSGTTGPSKGVMLSHRAAWYAGSDAGRYRGLGPDDVFSTTLPLFHLNAQHLTTVAVLVAGATLALERGFSASGFWAQLRTSQATHVNFIGAMLGILVQRPPSDEERSDRPRVAFGGPLSAQAIEAGRNRWNIRFLTGYGATESGIVTYADAEGLPLGSFGRAIPEFEIDLIDEQGRSVPDGVPGEIVTRPARAGSMMSGYFGRPDKTVEAWTDLWFHTGDMARRDADGFYYFLDRKKDALRRRGENISSAELEAALIEHPAIVEAAVVAVPSELSEDDVKAVVRLGGDAEFDVGEFLAWCDRALPRYMVPRYVEVVSEFPRTPTQRIEKYKLREKPLNAATWDRERGTYREDDQ